MSEKNHTLFRYVEGGKRAVRWNILSQKEKARLRRKLYRARARVFLGAAKFKRPEALVDGERVELSAEQLDIQFFNKKGYPEKAEVTLADGSKREARFASGMWKCEEAA